MLAVIEDVTVYDVRKPNWLLWRLSMCTVVLLVRLAGSEAVDVYSCTPDHTGSTSQCSQQSAGGWTWQVAMNNGADNLVELARW